MKTIGFPLYQQTPQTDIAPAMQKICSRYTGKVSIKIRDNVIDPRQTNEIGELGRYAGQFIEVVADGPDEAQLAAAVHQQLAEAKYSY
ncbi:MAG TPA: HPr family phosphocarrier protein [Candidatus Levilactobacillus faecigallinarum]|uniref:HPr family phosphocarrier protein n=1 Tax=Candidatus Levilactobacillus faecigallinarum TaxID=2838638 RepID=A0A9D1U504_9LACO|nr:HPr family phosphocarrier protein [Candidatus Levilactobacillus faecigallinarum]